MEEMHFRQSTFHVDVIRVVTRVGICSPKNHNDIIEDHISIGDGPITYISRYNL